MGQSRLLDLDRRVGRLGQQITENFRAAGVDEIVVVGVLNELQPDQAAPPGAPQDLPPQSEAGNVN